MKKALLFASTLVTSVGAFASDKPQVTLGGEVGAADKASFTRFESAPYDSLAWIRADLTGEKASDSDNAGWGHILFRPFKNFSGDISGRFIEIMALNAQSGNAAHSGYKTLLKDLPAYQRPGGYFAASGELDWQKPIDNKDIYTSTMMPALWGNARLLCGLVEASRADPSDTALLATARKLGDFYAAMLPRFADPARLDEYRRGDTYAAGYVTCYFPAMEGLVKLFQLTGERKYLDTAVTMATFYQQFDKLPIDHAHGMLCNQVSLLLLYEATKDASYLARVEKRWDALVAGGYINPAGGILEKCKVKFGRDEGCAIVDWFRLNLALGRVTGKARYWSMAERTLHNHLLQNQSPKGGFGHRGTLCDEEGVLGFKGHIEEATWCCVFHGQLAFINLKDNLIADTGKILKTPLALDFSVKTAVSAIDSVIEPAAAPGEVMRQRIRLSGMPAKAIQIRKPEWADAVQALTVAGKELEVSAQGDYVNTVQPVSEAVFVYKGNVYAENRRCARLPAGPTAGESCVLGYGPKLLAIKGKTSTCSQWPLSFAQVKEEGFLPFSPNFRTSECCFVTVLTNRTSAPTGPTEPVTQLLGNRFVTFSTLVRVNQIETTRDTVHGADEAGIHGPEEARIFREAVEKGFPGARITWGFSWLALKDQRTNYVELRKQVVAYHKQYGDEITFVPGGYFANMYNTREQVNRDLHEALQMVSEMVGGGYRPRAIIAGFLAAENLRYLAEQENIHVCQGNIWSQYAVDNGDGEGSLCYPYYPSREHFCKPAQGKTDLIDCVNLDGWTVDFLCARIPGGRRVNGEHWRSRQGVGPIETLLDMGTERGTEAMLAATAAHFDDGFSRNGFGWVTSIWELSLVEARKIYGYKGRNGIDGLIIWLTEIRKRWPETKCITHGEFGELWRAQYKDNEKVDYRFVQQGCGIRASEADKEISWFMNKDFRLALLRDLKTNTPAQVIDFTRYDLPAGEPADPEPGQQSRNWSLMNRLNQKGVRPQDKPIALQQLTPEEQSLIQRRYPELIGGKTDAAGWQPLFNGTDLSGWTVQCKSKDQGKVFWQVEAGTILCDSLGRPDHDYCWLVSDKEYGDFELRLKFQAYTNSPGNSGLQFRSRYDKDDQGGWLNGPQVDIHPPASQSWRTGLIYDETRGEQRWVSPSLPNWKIGAEHKLAGHVFNYAHEGDGWNDLLLIARGNHIKTLVNGVVCTDWDGTGTLDNAAHRAKNVGRTGHFALQLHAKDQLRIRFKDLAIREFSK